MMIRLRGWGDGEGAGSKIGLSVRVLEQLVLRYNSECFLYVNTVGRNKTGTTELNHVKHMLHLRV